MRWPILREAWQWFVAVGAVLMLLSFVGAIIIYSRTGTAGNVWFTLDAIVGLVGIGFAGVFAPAVYRSEIARLKQAVSELEGKVRALAK